MIAFSHITSTTASRPQLYQAVRAAEQAGDHAAQNHLLRFLDRAAWPMALGGLVCAASFPAAVAIIATTSIGRKPEVSLTGKPETTILETKSFTTNQREISL